MDIHGGNICNRQIEYDFSVNINPLGCSKRIKEAIQREIEHVDEYPEYGAITLRKKLANKLNISDKQIAICSGASEAFLAICHANRYSEGIVVAPNFYGYNYATSSIDATIKEVDSVADLYNVDDYSNKVVFLANPNNPDGKSYKAQELINIIDYIIGKSGDVILDECFIMLSDNYRESLINVINCNDNYERLYIVRSFTKTFAIPGVRLGYLVNSSSENIRNVSRHLPEWNVSNIALAAGDMALELVDELNDARIMVSNERDYLFTRLENMGIKVYPSCANFLLLKSEYDLKDELLKRKILIRDCSNYSSLDVGFYRIAVLNRKANEALINSLTEIING